MFTRAIDSKHLEKFNLTNDRLHAFAVEIVDSTLGYTMEFSSNPYAHREIYDRVEQRLICVVQDAVARVLSEIEELPRVKHLKRGSTYQVLGTAQVQASMPIHEGDKLEVYQCEGDRTLWVRPPVEFEDGRFVGLSGKSVTTPR